MALAASNALPDDAGYVAAAYLVFLALLLIYVAIMAYKLARIGREVSELHDLVTADDDEPAAGARSPAARQESHV